MLGCFYVVVRVLLCRYSGVAGVFRVVARVLLEHRVFLGNSYGVLGD